MKLHVDHLYTYIEGTWPRNILDPATSYFVYGAWFTPSYKKGHWDGYVRFIKFDRKRKQHFFATGFLSRATRALDKADYPYELFDSRSYEVPEACYELNGVRLDQGKWSFQARAVDTLLAHGRGIVKVPRKSVV